MILLYDGFNKKSKCRVDVFGNVVIATQLTSYDNTGTSITNAIEVVAKAACDQFNIKYEDLILIEHNEDQGYQLVKLELDNVKGTYDQVFKNVKWKNISINDIANLLKKEVGINKVENFISEDKKRLEQYYQDRIELLEGLCPHSHTIEYNDNEEQCFLCEKIIKH